MGRLTSGVGPGTSRARRRSASRCRSAIFLGRYGNWGHGLGLVVMYSYTCQPPGDSNDYEIGQVAIGAAAIHCLIIVAMSPRPSSNHVVCRWGLCVASSFLPVSAHRRRPTRPAASDQVIRQRLSLNRCFRPAHIHWPSPSIQCGLGGDQKGKDRGSLQGLFL
jgi:hypothetical protein